MTTTGSIHLFPQIQHSKSGWVGPTADDEYIHPLVSFKHPILGCNKVYIEVGAPRYTILLEFLLLNARHAQDIFYRGVNNMSFEVISVNLYKSKHPMYSSHVRQNHLAGKLLFKNLLDLLYTQVISSFRLTKFSDGKRNIFRKWQLLLKVQ